MNRSAVWIGVLVTACMFAHATPAAAGKFDAEQSFTKLTRGFVNIITGWVEIPKRISETSMASGPAAGVTWGVLRGVGHGFIRTTAGFYELLTFIYPAPAGYEPPEQQFGECAGRRHEQR